MKIFWKEIRFSTRSKYELVNITHEVEKIVAESGIRNGIVLVFAPHATAAIYLNEDESGLKEDILRKIREFFEDPNYKHDLIDDNAHAHVGSAFIKSFVVLPLINGKIVRGTWQDIFFVEMDGPRGFRRVIVEVIGE